MPVAYQTISSGRRDHKKWERNFFLGNIQIYLWKHDIDIQDINNNVAAYVEPVFEHRCIHSHTTHALHTHTDTHYCQVFALISIVTIFITTCLSWVLSCCGLCLLFVIPGLKLCTQCIMKQFSLHRTLIIFTTLPYSFYMNYYLVAPVCWSIVCLTTVSPNQFISSH
jgi:hypothetical protein